jgi:serine/threonine protein kinase
VTTAAGPTLPERIGRYRVVARIGKGAMGSVYSAVDEQLGRQVAVKLMLAEFEEDPELRERFFREARITGQLAHRNIVTVFDLGEEAGRPYIVMELLDGLPLNEYLRKDPPIPLDTKLDLMIQICDGLQNAHQAGVVHRDLKPSNLLIVRDGTAKVLDFGVARLAASNLTAAGMLLGTPEYMSPEQARGQKMDGRADLFSAAGVFYFMLAGHPPFGSRDLRKVLQAIIAEPPPALTDDQAPEALRHVLAKALAKSPDDRYQQCIDLRADIEQVRRTLNATSSRVIQAALDRYQQILAVIGERRTLGRSLSIPEIDEACDGALAALSARFRMFADPSSPPSLDKAAATAALEGLQQRHNAEQAALAALHERVTDSMRPASAAPPKSRGSFWRGLLKTRD